MGIDQSEDKCLYHEDNEEYYLELHKSESQEYIFLYSGTKVTQFALYLSTRESTGDMKPLSPKIEGEDYFVTHRGGHFFFTRRSDKFFNSELLVAPVDNISAFSLLLPHRPRYFTVTSATVTCMVTVVPLVIADGFGALHCCVKGLIFLFKF